MILHNMSNLTSNWIIYVDYLGLIYASLLTINTWKDQMFYLENPKN